MKLKILLISLLTLFLISSSWSESRYVAETYKLIIPPQPTQTGDKIEVLEIFWYGCPHCYDLEPHLEHWLKSKPDDVEFVRVPGILGRGWLAHAKAFYTAEKMGVLDKIHRPLFDAIHKKGKHITNEKKLKEFFISQGVDGDEFSEIYNSEAIDAKVKEAFILGKNYKITGVPTIIVNGKFRTTASISGGNAGIINTINELTDRERTLLTTQN
jgi:thiol:disulfide interchange protein DsbA